MTADATATVGDIARTLVLADPLGGASTAGEVTLHVADVGGAAGGGRTLQPSTTIVDSGLLSGAFVEVVGAEGMFQPVSSADAVAIVRVLSGPDAGREFPLGVGSSLIGRDHTADVRLSDPMVSKRHARVNVGDHIEVIDENSANGVLIGGAAVARGVLASTDLLTLGDTTLSIVVIRRTEAAGLTSQIDHVRGPRVVPPRREVVLPAPQPPTPPERQRLPWLALVAPLLMGAVVWAVTHQVLGVILVALSPLLLIGGVIDQRLAARRKFRAENAVFRQGIERLREQIDRAHDDERAQRRAELPSCAELVADARRGGPLLWVERPESPTFLSLAVGAGRVRSRVRVENPSPHEAPADAAERIAGEIAHAGFVGDAPVPVDLSNAGSLGYAGPGDVAGVARAGVLQLLLKHSPAEVVLMAIVSPSARADWEWVKWMPHRSSSHSPVGVPHLADRRSAASDVLAALESLIDERLGGEQPLPRGRSVTAEELPQIGGDAPGAVPAVVLLVDNTAPADRARVTRVAERGPDARVHVIWCAPRVEDLPAACRSFVEVSADQGVGSVGQVRAGETVSPVALESCSVAVAEHTARLLSPVVDVGVPEADDSDLPRTVPFPALIGPEILDDPDSVIERWKQNDSLVARDGSAPRRRSKAGNLRAVVGHAGTQPFVLDLRADGPHALVGGTTGAGKSEFLQSWVLGMASAHSPDRLTFLFVDYKGGSAFADCIDLPHTVGLVTDLSPHLVRRALTSLRAELRYREHLLNAKKAKDLVSLEKTGDPDCPPSLVIIVDEFAALVSEVPEFVDGVVDVAQRGRSLGLHLILATQRPAGVIKDNLRANTNLRIALRMADADDSADILGDRMAAHFDPAIPGRGAAKGGPSRLTTFQSGYAGGRTTGEAPKPRIEVEELGFGPHAAWEMPAALESPVEQSGPTDIQRIVHTVRRASSRTSVPVPRKPWLEELAAVYNFSRLPNPRTDERLLLGVRDEPATQSQPPVFYEPDRDGNLAIYGTGGAGKSTALRTLAVAAAASGRNGGPVHVYALDFGSRGLSMLESLPHVGAVVIGDDHERVARLLRLLRDTVNERAVRYSALSAGTIGEYRKLSGLANEPRILLLVDGVGAFREQYENGPTSRHAWFTAFAQIAADGRAVGVHVVVAGDRPNSVPASINSTVQRRIVLRMANDDEYQTLGVARDVLGPTSPAGRGILDGDEIQIAVLGENGNVAVQARELQRLSASVSRAGIVPPMPIRRLPDRVDLAELSSVSPDGIVLGVDDLTLGPALVEPSGAFLIAGPPRSGRSTAAATIAASIARARPAWSRTLVSLRRSSVRGEWTTRIESAEDLTRALPELRRLVQESQHCHLLVLESVGELDDHALGSELAGLVRDAVRNEHFVIGEAEASAWARVYDLGKIFRSAKRGVVLGAAGDDVYSLLDARVPVERSADVPVGRGFYGARGAVSRVQVAVSTGG
ncbi:FtsK/SpoIIIE domain-containing protein [Microbacterium sp. B19]|uniref:FtsK/SpoIIIE domain-containing protein n=1 Tax=Microbacterium sp. B19 TaxID=96765 RepID=UPI001EF9D2E4|nr:FtsK/SpoIIIE domain-containing protein [Microbacterium sp. B19]